jgi:hypothetical protein
VSLVGTLQRLPWLKLNSCQTLTVANNHHCVFGESLTATTMTKTEPMSDTDCNLSSLLCLEQGTKLGEVLIQKAFRLCLKLCTNFKIIKSIIPLPPVAYLSQTHHIYPPQDPKSPLTSHNPKTFKISPTTMKISPTTLQT